MSFLNGARISEKLSFPCDFPDVNDPACRSCPHSLSTLDCPLTTAVQDPSNPLLREFLTIRQYEASSCWFRIPSALPSLVHERQLSNPSLLTPSTALSMTEPHTESPITGPIAVPRALSRSRRGSVSNKADAVLKTSRKEEFKARRHRFPRSSFPLARSLLSLATVGEGDEPGQPAH